MFLNNNFQFFNHTYQTGLAFNAIPTTEHPPLPQLATNRTTKAKKASNTKPTKARNKPTHIVTNLS